jgi:hypothetical protein
LARGRHQADTRGWIFIELVNWPFLTEFMGGQAEFGASLRYATEQGWFWTHESGTYWGCSSRRADVRREGKTGDR